MAEKGGSPNLVLQTLLGTRTRHLDQQRAAGADVSGEESTAQIWASQINDPDLARAVASLPWQRGTAMLGAIASSREPTRILRHLVSESGKDQLARWTAPGVGFTQIFREVAMLEAQAQQPIKQKTKAQAPPVVGTTTVSGNRPITQPPQPAAPQGGYVVDRGIDRGVGLTEDMLDKLFEEEAPSTERPGWARV